MASLEDIKKMFQYWTPIIWGEKVANAVVFDYEIKSQKAPMAIGGFKIFPQSFENKAYRINKYHHIYIAPRTLNLPVDKIEKIVKHEIIHIGYQYHNEEFFKLCRQFDADLTEKAQTEHPFQVQIKEGTRYKTINSFDTEKEAVLWMREYFNTYKPAKIRVFI